MCDWRGRGGLWYSSFECVHKGGRRTNPYNGSLLDDCNLASKEPMYGVFRQSRA